MQQVINFLDAPAVYKDMGLSLLGLNFQIISLMKLKILEKEALLPWPIGTIRT